MCQSSAPARSAIITMSRLWPSTLGPIWWPRAMPTTPALLERRKTEWGITKVRHRPGEHFALNPEVDAVIIATPNFHPPADCPGRRPPWQAHHVRESRFGVNKGEVRSMYEARPETRRSSI